MTIYNISSIDRAIINQNGLLFYFLFDIDSTAQFIRSAKVSIRKAFAYFSILKLAYTTLKKAVHK